MPCQIGIWSERHAFEALFPWKCGKISRYRKFQALPASLLSIFNTFLCQVSEPMALFDWSWKIICWNFPICSNIVPNAPCCLTSCAAVSIIFSRFCPRRVTLWTNRDLSHDARMIPVCCTLQRQTYSVFLCILCDAAKATNSCRKFCNQMPVGEDKPEHHWTFVTSFLHFLVKNTNYIRCTLFVRFFFWEFSGQVP